MWTPPTSPACSTVTLSFSICHLAADNFAAWQTRSSHTNAAMSRRPRCVFQRKGKDGHRGAARGLWASVHGLSVNISRRGEVSGKFMKTWKIWAERGDSIRWAKLIFLQWFESCFLWKIEIKLWGEELDTEKISEEAKVTETLLVWTWAGVSVQSQWSCGFTSPMAGVSKVVVSRDGTIVFECM